MLEGYIPLTMLLSATLYKTKIPKQYTKYRARISFIKRHGKNPLSSHCEQKVGRLDAKSPLVKTGLSELKMTCKQNADNNIRRGHTGAFL